jgi:hypothetical protein
MVSDARRGLQWARTLNLDRADGNESIRCRVSEIGWGWRA